MLMADKFGHFYPPKLLTVPKRSLQVATLPGADWSWCWSSKEMILSCLRTVHHITISDIWSEGRYGCCDAIIFHNHKDTLLIRTLRSSSHFPNSHFPDSVDKMIPQNSKQSGHPHDHPPPDFCAGFPNSRLLTMFSSELRATSDQ